MRPWTLMAVGAIAGAAAGLAALPLAQGADQPDAKSAYGALDRFGEAFAVVRAKYVDVPDDRTMVEDALNGMISDLDPHSSYFDPKTFADMQVKTEGSYGGVGLVIAADKGAITVVSPIDDTPASRAGIKSGDTILAIDGKGLQGLSLDKVQELLRGASGSKLAMTLMRPGAQKSFEVTLERAAIQVEAVKSHREGDIGYIRIPAFNEQTSEGLEAAVRALKKQIGPHVRGYIVDLRDDGGGVLDQAIAVSDDFLNRGEIVSTRGRVADDTQRYDAKPGDIAEGKPVIVLINGGTASASEIVAGALQDHRRATILGTTSFGKGSVQTIIPLNGGEDGALHLTTARYYTPSGRSIQAKGIVPDIEVLQDLPDDIKAKTDTSTKGEASLRGHLKGDAGKEQTGSQSYVPPDPKNDKALTMAEDLLRGTQVNSAFPPNPKAPVPN